MTPEQTLRLECMKLAVSIYLLNRKEYPYPAKRKPPHEIAEAIRHFIETGEPRTDPIEEAPDPEIKFGRRDIPLRARLSNAWDAFWQILGTTSERYVISNDKAGR